jgi:hypothetical protein
MLNRRSFLKTSLTAGVAIIPSGFVLHDLNVSQPEYCVPVVGMSKCLLVSMTLGSW